MFDTIAPSTQKTNLATYRDKVLGCWTGKNIGGTIGAPFEGKREINQVTFYTQELGGQPAPNDDLDLQLVWLLAAEENGVFRLNERILGEYWLTYITGPWNEYGVCKANIRNGLVPPLSGSCNNDRWKFSNGAWIRSEIWACLFPGSPDEAAQFAYYDACCDHSGDGIYAEIFTASMESAAFVVSDIRELIKIGLSRIPADSRIARSVKLACELYDTGSDFLTAREAVVKDSEDLGWFQAPANIGFVIIGLLYGEGDFGKSVCLATNCGDDTDCTAGTVGSILGIILGRSGIPTKWIEPIGESIQTCSIATYRENRHASLPKTVGELTNSVVRLAIATQRENPTLPEIADLPTAITADYLEKLHCAEAVSNRIWNRSPYELAFDLPYGQFSVDYDKGPYVVPGERKKLTLKISNIRFIEAVVSVKLVLPEGWRAQGAAECIFMARYSHMAIAQLTIIPGEFTGAYYYLPVEVRLFDRFNPIVVHLPLQRQGSVEYYPSVFCQDFFDASSRCKSRAQAAL
jgi:ADP-ribosylglycohydrolase